VLHNAGESFGRFLNKHRGRRRDRWGARPLTFARARTRFPGSRPRCRIEWTRPRSSHYFPADAPCRPPEPAPFWEIVDPPSTLAGPCDATFDTCDAEDRLRRRLLLLPTLCRFLLRRCFLSLLRHCCPPKYRCSAVANRSALHPDYYSRKKITVTPLDFVRKRHFPRHHAMCAALASTTPYRKTFRSRSFARKFRYNTKVPIKYGFS
jgi:hypothetical protein